MSAIPSRSTNKMADTLWLCRTSIAATWKLGLALAATVTFLSLTAGALPATSIIRGGISFLVLGFIGWGINAILVAAGEKEEPQNDADAENEENESSASFD